MAVDDIDIGAPVGDEGYLINPADWTEAIAEGFAKQEGIALSGGHWQIVRFIRDWYGEHGVAPSSRDVTLFMKSINAPRNHLYALFPYGYVQQACKIAGMKKPRSWSTG